MANDREKNTDAKPKSSGLFSYSVLDGKDDIDERLEDCQKCVTTCVASGLRETEIYEQLNLKVCRSQQDHDETVLALLYMILTSPADASKWYSTLTMVTRDSMAIVLQISELLILEKLPKLLETTRVQLLWLAKEMAHTGVSGADRLCFAFLKQMPVGSSDPGDIWLAENLMRLLLDNRSWMESNSHLIASVVYTYLSLLPHHLTCPLLSHLKDNEIQLIISLIRTKFNDCLQIGRDLIRLLQNISRVPDISQLLFDMINYPGKFSSNYTGLQQLLSKRTSRRFIAARIVTDAEIKLNFMLSKVKFGQHRKYQEWFCSKYLSSIDSLHMIPELIRFVCCVIHPSNEILGSDIMPRWALIGWLLSLCQTNQVIFANAKLALFYDWIVYSPDNDNIMNIEPAALLMFNSLRTHPQMTMSLLDFICRLIPNYSITMETQLRDSFQTAFNDIASKGVLPSIDSLLFSVKLDKELRNMIKSTFPVFSSNKSPDDSSVEDELIIIDDSFEEGGTTQDVPIEITDDDNNIADSIPVDSWSYIDKLPLVLKEKLQLLQKESNSLELLRSVLNQVQEGDYNNEMLRMFSYPLLCCINDDLSITCNTDNLDERPYYCLISCIRKSVGLLMTMRDINIKLGYYILFYCYKNKCYDVYESVIKDDNVQKCLCVDLKMCAEEDNEVFFSILLDVCNKYSNELIGCSVLINTIVSNIDPRQLNELIICLSLKKVVLFGKQIQDITSASLQWESFEQLCYWQLVCSEGPEVHHIVPLLKLLIPNDHPEAVSGIILILRQEPSIPGAVGNLLSLPVDIYGSIISAVFSRWAIIKPNKIAKFVEYCFGKVQKLNEPLSTLTVMFDNFEQSMNYIPTDEIFKASEHLLCFSLKKLFDLYPVLQTRCPYLFGKAEQYKSELNKPIKRRQSTDNNNDIITKTKRRRIIIDDSSD